MAANYESINNPPPGEIPAGDYALDKILKLALTRTPDPIRLGGVISRGGFRGYLCAHQQIIISQCMNILAVGGRIAVKYSSCNKGQKQQ